MLLKLINIQKETDSRELFKIDELTINSGSRIGIIGANGAGKSTLLNIISGCCETDGGKIIRNCRCGYFRQLEKKLPDLEAASTKHWSTNDVHEFSSGGEQTRWRLAAVFAEQPDLLLLDEPTANLDANGINFLQNLLQKWPGALILVSHDRDLLNNICNEIWELAAGKIQTFPGNYNAYCCEKQRVQREKQRNIENYYKEKNKLRRAIQETTSRSSKIKRTPSRMGNSEARLHKMGDQRAKGNIDKAATALRSRLERLERPDSSDNEPVLIFDLLAQHDLFSRNIASAQNLCRSYSGKTVLDNISFNVRKGARIALTGCNGCGKTTLLRAIAQRDSGITIATRARIGYFDQSLSGLDEKLSILDNVKQSSVYNETFIRTLLARLKFRTDSVYKQVAILSGGERVRVLLAKIMTQNCNLLIFDEPTNFLDIPSLEAVESVLSEFSGTLLFTSHDRQFVNKVATEIWRIEAGRLQIL